MRRVDRQDFLTLADCFGRRELIDLLGVDRKTLARWLTGRARIPWAAHQLMHERSKYGLAERDALDGFGRQLMRLQLDALRKRVAWLESELVREARLVDWQSANDPYTAPSDPRSAIRL